jgi:hypothetical protein
VEGFVCFNIEQGDHLNLAWQTKPTEIVAEQIDYHDIFAAVLDISGQTSPQLQIFIKAECPAAGPLHRPDHAIVTFFPEKKLWGKRKDSPVTAPDQGTVGNTLVAAQGPVKVTIGTAISKKKFQSIIDLVSVTGLYVSFDPVNFLQVIIFIFTEGQIADPTARAG